MGSNGVTTRYWFRCPGCKAPCLIDYDQAKGISPIFCTCGYKETGLVVPLLEYEEQGEAFMASFHTTHTPIF